MQHVFMCNNIKFEKIKCIKPSQCINNSMPYKQLYFFLSLGKSTTRATGVIICKKGGSPSRHTFYIMPKMVKKLWKSATCVVEILLLLQLHHRVWLLTFEMLKPVVTVFLKDYTDF